MNNKTYDAIKWIVVTVLPAASVFVAALGHIYGWGIQMQLWQL